ncbi:hypothetical protein CLOM_g18309 [Closterium sp. NIES-68]|nr:hypothetical protein CLOM_g18309 [Closterium sp. NIES-68]
MPSQSRGRSAVPSRAGGRADGQWEGHWDPPAFRRWLVGFAAVRFDLEQGQLVEALFPAGALSAEEEADVAFSSFPDSMSTVHNRASLYDCVFFFRIRRRGVPPADSAAASSSGGGGGGGGVDCGGSGGGCSDDKAEGDGRSPLTPHSPLLQQQQVHVSFSRGAAGGTGGAALAASQAERSASSARRQSASPPRWDPGTNRATTPGTTPRRGISVGRGGGAAGAVAESMSAPASSLTSPTGLLASAPSPFARLDRCATEPLKGGEAGEEGEVQWRAQAEAGALRHSASARGSAGLAQGAGREEEVAVYRSASVGAGGRMQGQSEGEGGRGAGGGAGGGGGGGGALAGVRSGPRYLYGFVFNRQRHDERLPRGGEQKSVVVLSARPFSSAFRRLAQVVGPLYFDRGPIAFVQVAAWVSLWPAPYQASSSSIETTSSSGGRRSSVMELPVGPRTSLRVQLPPAHTLPPASHSPLDDFTAAMAPAPLNTSAPQGIFHDADVFGIFTGVVAQLWVLWELLLIGEPLLVLAPTPAQCSEAVAALVGLIAPLPCSLDFRPYFTIHDPDFPLLNALRDGDPIPPVVLGVTNLFFLKALKHLPHVLSIGRPPHGGHGVAGAARYGVGAGGSLQPNGQVAVRESVARLPQQQQQSPLRRLATSGLLSVFSAGTRGVARMRREGPLSLMAEHREALWTNHVPAVKADTAVLNRLVDTSTALHPSSSSLRPHRSASSASAAAASPADVGSLASSAAAAGVAAGAGGGGISLSSTRPASASAPSSAASSFFSLPGAVAGSLLAGVAGVTGLDDSPADGSAPGGAAAAGAARQATSMETVAMVNNEILRRHFIELTTNFLAPFGPFLRAAAPPEDTSPFCDPPPLLPFDAADFLGQLAARGPGKFLAKRLQAGRWLEVYRRFLEGPNFMPWFQRRRAVAEAEQHRLWRAARLRADARKFVEGMGEGELMEAFSCLATQMADERQAWRRAGEPPAVGKLRGDLRVVFSHMPPAMQHLLLLSPTHAAALQLPPSATHAADAAGRSSSAFSRDSAGAESADARWGQRMRTQGSEGSVEMEPGAAASGGPSGDSPGAVGGSSGQSGTAEMVEAAQHLSALVANLSLPPVIAVNGESEKLARARSDVSSPPRASGAGLARTSSGASPRTAGISSGGDTWAGNSSSSTRSSSTANPMTTTSSSTSRPVSAATSPRFAFSPVVPFGRRPGLSVGPTPPRLSASAPGTPLHLAPGGYYLHTRPSHGRSFGPRQDGRYGSAGLGGESGGERVSATASMGEEQAGEGRRGRGGGGESGAHSNGAGHAHRLPPPGLTAGLLLAPPLGGRAQD